MVPTSPPTTPTMRPWAKAIRHIPTEFQQQDLTILSGDIPLGLQGTLYRNGPGRLVRNGQTMGHWFDGDGAILGVKFAAGQAQATYRFVQTTGYQAETKAERLLFNNYGTHPPGSWLQRLRGLKNSANTSVMALDDRLLALWEGGQPHQLDLADLATQGFDDLAGSGGRLSNGNTYSAHYKQDAHTGEIFNFGMQVGYQPGQGLGGQIQLYRSNRAGRIQQQSHFFVRGIPLLHDFVLAGRYMVFCIPPVRVQPLPLVLHRQTFSEAMRWQPERGTEIVIVDRDTLNVVQRITTDPWFQWHFSNGCELADGSIMLEIARYADFATNQFLKEVPTGHAPTIARSGLWQLRIDPQRGKILANSPRLERQCEFPSVAPEQVGQPWQTTYLSLQRQPFEGNELLSTIGRLTSSGDLAIAPMPAQHYAVEPIYAPNPEQPGQGWIITVVYNHPTAQSEVWIFAVDRLADGPIAQLRLPDIIPPGFHGTWKAA
ncbi:carotenoid oxygenase family protein [filamentous cyanobacterium LEGE 11480]|uniref:Carotenoid oxygenase family protein n=1 Tax=Romeriopsis navalis LEGE 11480 TaxID=2777977 RepID=A0A928VHU1_9CYAN|nr:carotenoid oxygenase family protein [Romeriopsis navalis]MBE9028866.1 carotenoid oxygenase family protein [Romeriopsis navalis LEGE 11480]